MFQNEASALLSVPTHKNLARFVTFDLGARPKPILVMELVDGVTLETLVSRRQLTTARALRARRQPARRARSDARRRCRASRSQADQCSHAPGRGPRARRLRARWTPHSTWVRERTLRSAEIWGWEKRAEPSSPTAADVYAAACLAYEALTTQPLFDQPTEVALTTAHVSHDGWPTPLRSWHRQKDLAPVAELVGRALRRNPRDRIDVSTFE